jgi:hypothetical protein
MPGFISQIYDGEDAESWLDYEGLARTLNDNVNNFAFPDRPSRCSYHRRNGRGFLR